MFDRKHSAAPQGKARHRTAPYHTALRCCELWAELTWGCILLRFNKMRVCTTKHSPRHITAQNRATPHSIAQYRTARQGRARQGTALHGAALLGGAELMM